MYENKIIKRDVCIDMFCCNESHKYHSCHTNACVIGIEHKTI